MGPAGPFSLRDGSAVATKTHDKERQLQEEIGSLVERDLPGVEVLAVELASPDRFVVFVDHADGVDHALCARVTDALRDYLREYSIDVSSPGIERPLRKPAHFAARRRPARRAAHARAARRPLQVQGRRPRTQAPTPSRSTSREPTGTFRTRRSCGAI